MTGQLKWWKASMGLLLWLTSLTLTTLGFLSLIALQPTMINFWMSAAFGSMVVWTLGAIGLAVVSDRFMRALEL